MTLALLAIAGASSAQPGAGPMPVGVTAALQTEVRGTVSLPGSVEARTSGTVASEVAGVVIEIAAREGQRVERGQTLVRLRRETLEIELTGAEAELAEATARLELATRSAERLRGLFESGVVSRQQLDDADTESAAWTGRMARAKATAARLRDQLDRSRVRAPFGGVVVREHCDVGEWVAVGGAVVDLVDIERLEIVVNVPEQYFGGSAAGDTAEVRVTSLDDLEVAGRVVAVIPRADAEARTFPLKVEIPNPSGRIAPGMLASVALPSGAARSAVVVPKDAITVQGGQRIVYVVDGTDEPSSIAARPVEVGGSAGAWSEVDGVEVGELVVTRGNERVMPGVTVTTETVEYSAP